jgi:hypothetical protein
MAASALTMSSAMPVKPHFRVASSCWPMAARWHFTVNDVLFHNAMEDLPFGGVGPSGMGNYHGFDGFKTFSHAKAVYRQPKLDVAGLGGFKPPYGASTHKTLARELKK